MSKKKLLVIAGAGSSIEFGMPSVSEINNLFNDWALEILPLVSDSKKSLYASILEKLEVYAMQNRRNRLEFILNFENLLFTIQNLESLLKDSETGNFNHRLNPFIDFKKLPEIVRFGNPEVVESFDLGYLHSHLIDKLLSHFRELCRVLTHSKKMQLAKLRSFLERLRDNYDIGIINLNYDNVILSSLPDLETGFNPQTGEFNPSRIFNKNWNFCYHLHGSVHFDMKSKGTDLHNIHWNQDLNSQFQQNSSGRSSRTTSEGISHQNSAIIAGLDKSNQILKEPFSIYYSEIDRLVFEADGFLFLGYGFSDKHLNKSFPIIRKDGRNRIPVVIDWADEDEDGLQFRHDGWTSGLSACFPYNSHEMGDGTLSIPKAAYHYKKNKIFERSTNSKFPLKVWYNGLLEACDNSNLILKELQK